MDEEIKKAYEKGYQAGLEKALEVLRDKLYVSGDILYLFARFVSDEKPNTHVLV